MAKLGLRGVLAVLAAALGASEPRATHDWLGWEARKATITEITVHVLPVFDLSKPAENGWLGRGANRLHVASREGLVRRTLLFQAGDRVHARDIYQTERLLRGLEFIKDAHIVPEPLADGSVRAQVWVRDAWTLDVRLGYEQVGGHGSLNYGIQEQNFFGTGKTVGFSVVNNQERSGAQFRYRDPQLLGSRWRLSTEYRSFSDGTGRLLNVERPFFALDTPWSGGLSSETRTARLLLYDHSQGVYAIPFRSTGVRLDSAWAVRQSEDRAWRAGLALRLSDAGYGAVTRLSAATLLAPPDPADRRERGPALTLAYRREAFETFQDLQGMDLPEDYNLALEGDLELGSLTRALGSTQPGSYAQLRLSDGWSPSERQLTLFQGSLRVRGGRRDGENLAVASQLTSYLQVTPRYHLAGYLGAARIQRPDPENYDYLGGLQGLRGYPNAVHPGDAHWLASLEQRWLTGQRWWGLFRVGYVGFLDLGAVHRLDGQGWSRTYPDLGVGLRLGDLKSSLARVLAITVATPLARPPGQKRILLGITNSVRF